MPTRKQNTKYRNRKNQVDVYLFNYLFSLLILAYVNLVLIKEA